jgi:hypothetical protein
MKLDIHSLAVLVTNSPISQKDIGIGIILAESGGVTDARNLVINPPSKAHLSYDRGLWQWNSYWHPDITDEMADDPVKSTEITAWKSQGGTHWSLWVTFNHNAHVKFLPAAQMALAAVLE